ncbi:MAG TPA: hypothetical protein VHC44_03670 [Verrucomicrobiae bacterium]|nr:hypothetical protein [Verrucomicrobiae bacterium]
MLAPSGFRLTRCEIESYGLCPGSQTERKPPSKPSRQRLLIANDFYLIIANHFRLWINAPLKSHRMICIRMKPLWTFLLTLLVKPLNKDIAALPKMWRN